MTRTKTDEFRRINDPRVNAAIEKLKLIEKSAQSMRIDAKDIADLLAPLIAEAEGMSGDPVPTPPEVDDMRLIEPTRPVKAEMPSLEGLSTQQLVDRMIAIGAILSNRRS